jgi:pimeloyl-ACP methyl ester carboxylesterase
MHSGGFSLSEPNPGVQSAIDTDGADSYRSSPILSRNRPLAVRGRLEDFLRTDKTPTMIPLRREIHHGGAKRIAGLALLAAALCIAPLGCATSKMTELRSAPKGPLVERLKLTSRKGPQASARTRQFLRVNDLEENRDDPKALLKGIQAIIEREPTAPRVYAFAELAFIEAEKAKKKEPELALDLYGASAFHAYQYLFDKRFLANRNPYDPQFRGACDLYNGALEGALRLICADQGLKPGKTYTIETASGAWHLQCSLRSSRWVPEDFDRFEFVSDYELKGLKNQYQTYGLGVPLIAVRRRHANEPPAAKYYPEGLSFPVTAFVRPLPVGNQDCCDVTAEHAGIIELHDPLAVADIAVGDVRVPLESDLTTPMAYFLNSPELNELATVGLLDPGKLLDFRANSQERIMGLYMVQPYEPGKIPVLLVHGLWSSPMTWMEMFNDLRSVPVIRENYQFWFYLYPTAQPFWISAGQLREDLAKIRDRVDPNHQERALDQMVLVGHSMGGLVSRLQTIESRDEFWKLVSDQPFSHVKADPEDRARLEKSLFFHPNPSVRRVVTVGTPHRGSEMSNDLTRWLSNKLIRLPDMLDLTKDSVISENKELIRDDRLLRIETSVDSLAPDSPFFPVMLAGNRAPWVRYHNIVGVLPKKGITGYLANGGDGVVAYSSAKMDDVVSEVTVPAMHSDIHAHPRAILEVRRILLEHLHEVYSSGEINPVRMAAVPWESNQVRSPGWSQSGRPVNLFAAPSPN